MMRSKLEILSQKIIPTFNFRNHDPDIELYVEDSTNLCSTLNNQGYMLPYLHQIASEFVDFSVIAPGPVLDIGTAYGFVALEALKKGAHVIANDLEIEHLENLHNRIPKIHLDKISYAVGRVPGEITFSPNSIGAVLASGILHYLSPPEFSLAFEKIACWLKPGGKFFIASPSPYTNFYEKFLPTFKKNRDLNKPWPGYIEDASKILPKFFTNIQRAIYLADEEFITKTLEENRFEVERMEYFNITLPTKQFSKQTNVLGVVARKL